VTIRIAIIGLGKIARDQHLPAIAADSAFSLAASVDPAAGPIDGIPHFTSLDALLESGTAVDAVAVCTPPQHRYGLAAKAIRAGKHALVEKPPCTTLSQAEALAALAGEQGAVLYAAWHSRHAAGVAPARAWLAGKTLRSVRIIWHEDVRVWHPGQAWIFAPGGFGVLDPAINALSIVTAILPRALMVDAAELAVPANGYAPIAGDVWMSDSTGVPVHLDMDFLQEGPPSWDIRIITDAGDLLLSKGGRILTTPNGQSVGADREYPSIYRDFGAAITAGRSEADFAPLALVADAFLCAAVRYAPEFHDPSATETR
jgi:D-galactose 1-dehydrogenase